MAIHVSYLLISSFSMWHSCNSDIYHILHKVPQDNAGYACSLYKTWICLAYLQLKLTPSVEHSPPFFYNQSPRTRSNSWWFRGHQRHASHNTSHIIFVCTIVAIIILYQIFKRWGCTHSIVKYCFLFFLILRILRGTCKTDLFMEVTNLMKGNTVWAYFTLTGYYPTSIRLLRQIPKEKGHTDTSCCCFKWCI